MAQGEKVAQLGAWVLDPNNGYTEYSEGFVDVHGLKNLPINEANVLEVCLKQVHPDDQETVREALAGLEAASLPLELVYRFEIPGQGLVWLQDILGHRLDDGRLVGTTRDITKRRTKNWNC